MFIPFKKLKPWTKKDYVFSILLFAMHYVVLCAIMLGAIILYSGSDPASMWAGFLEYFRTNINLFNSDTNMIIYSFLSLLIVTVALYIFFYNEMRDFILKKSNITVIFAVIEFSLIISIVTSKFVHIYARPMAMCALLILMLINKKSAFFVNFCFCITMFLIDVLVSDVMGTAFTSEVPIFLSLAVGCTTGVFAIYLVDGVSARIAVILKGFIISIPMLLTVFVIRFGISSGFQSNIKYLIYSFVSGITSVAYMMAVIPIFESIFNITTNYRLAELTDHKSKLIMRLKNEAPGTFNHCLVVATLAESCASAIGENALLARAAAYYHDMGKLKQPMMFTENQHGINPHDELTPELSTEIIRSHTKDGYEYIRKQHLPQFLADVAREHHGTLPIQYFYSKAQKFTEGEVDIADFSYQGPKPQSKIAAIIMLADGCEAAVRAQKDRSHERVESVVRGIIEDRMNNDQFTDCDLTMKDIEIIKNTLVDNLAGAYHDRISYPKIKIEHGVKVKNIEVTEQNEPATTNKVEEAEAKATKRKRKKADNSGE